MKKLIKRVASIFMAAAIMVTATATIKLAPSAESIYDTATSISSGKAVSTTLYTAGDCADYKVKVTEKGLLKLNITAEVESVTVYVYDSNGNMIERSISNSSITSGKFKDYSGSAYGWWDWNETVEKFKGVISYPVSKGDYYIRFMRHGYCNGNGKLSFTATFPSTTTTAKISYLTLELSKGSSIKLGTVVTPAGSAVTWKSSKPSVATVSGTGKVTAKAKGTTYITAQSGTSFQRIKIIVN